jgi:tetratricopeptide (TPR) repeat protein
MPVLRAVAVQPQADWMTENAAGLDSLQKGRPAEAAKSFARAVQLAEKFGADDDRLGESLNGLAEAYRLLEDYANAGAIYRRILAIRWSADSNKGDLAAAELIDRFADVLRRAYFKGPDYDKALKAYQEALNKTPVGAPTYVAMTSMLVKADLTSEAADVMERAVRSFPNSRQLRYKEAEMHRDSGKMRKALETFQAASQLKAPPTMPPERDRQQLSFIYQRMGGINTDIVDFDASIAAYKKAVEIWPENADARVALGDAYLRRGQYSEALTEYSNVLKAHSDSALPYYRIADANLQKGNFADAADAAGRALRIDPKHRKARYVNGMALLRLGRTDEGQKELELFRKQEGDAQADLNAERDVLVSNRGAASLLLKGQTNDALAAFQESIAAHPAAPLLRLNYGVALDMVGRPRDAAAAFQVLLEGGGDTFLVYKSLARAAEAMKDQAASAKFGALYIRKIDESFEEELR